jgi:hypothetical protein
MNIAVSSTAISAVSSVSTDNVGIGWPAVIDGCHDLLAVAFGTNIMDDPFDRACREADRKAAAQPQDPRLKRLRRLLENDVSLERAYQELLRNRPAPKATLEALVYSLRRGVTELTQPDAQRRLSELAEDQVKTICRRLQNFHPEIATPWSPEEVTALIAKYEELHG